jgi:hypothetical protein
VNEDGAVLFANEAFYHAFTNRDFEAMEALWASETPVICIHPGWEALSERDEIMDSWRIILRADDTLEIACREPRAIVRGELALVMCYEAAGRNMLVATNAFVREAGRWKMVHHQAGPTSYRPPIPDQTPDGRVH